MLLLSFLPLVITLGGIYTMFCLKFSFFFHPFRTFRMLLKSIRTKEARRALALALSGTLGVGNIVGVAVGISVGGAGSVFWLLLSAVFASVLKFSESALASDMADGRGGMITVIKKSFGKCGGVLSSAYALFCLLFAFVMGAALQSASAVECAAETFSFNSLSLAVVFTVGIAAVVIRGDFAIEKFAALIIPVATAVYVAISAAVIFLNAARIPEAFFRIFSEAFTLEGAGGGILGFLTSHKIREGYSRGLLSNEAGAGTSAMAEVRNSDAHPASVGLVGMCEVFFDTVLLCTLTAISILVSVPEPSLYNSGMLLVLDSIGAVFGGGSRLLVTLCVVAFAFSTVACWYYYGSEAFDYLFGGKRKLFFILYVASVFFGSQFAGVFLIKVTDYLMCGLTALSILAVIKNSDRIYRLSEDYGLIIPRF